MTMPPHSAVVSWQLVAQFKRDVSDHPTYSPDLSPDST
ncbi:hypothetical protein AVEN_160960-1, partial [Araneus ventricosus]